MVNGTMYAKADRLITPDKSPMNGGIIEAPTYPPTICKLMTLADFFAPNRSGVSCISPGYTGAKPKPIKIIPTSETAGAVLSTSSNVPRSDSISPARIMCLLETLKEMKPVKIRPTVIAP